VTTTKNLLPTTTTTTGGAEREGQKKIQNEILSFGMRRERGDGGSG
jgi:hypothetical protein